MEGNLYELLGVPANLGIDRLRARYEAAVEAATKSEDWRRAQQLSRAFDGLPEQVRLAVYAGRGHDTRLSPSSSTRPGRPGTASEQQTARPSAHYRRTTVRKPFRVAAYVVVVLLTLAAGVGGLQRAGLLRLPQEDRPSPAQTVLREPSGSRESVVVPALPVSRIAPDLRVGSDGKIVVIRQGPAFGSGTMMRVPPGTHVECASGADPQFRAGI